MNTMNPLPEFCNEQVILQGTFEAVYTGCDVTERPTFEDPSRTELALRLKFDVPSEGVTLAKMDGLRFGQKSNLRKDLRAMTGPDFSAEVFRNRDALWEHLQSLTGRRYIITCEPAESGLYTKITGIQPAKPTPTSRGRVNGAALKGPLAGEINI
jgi:hypothetical protein